MLLDPPRKMSPSSLAVSPPSLRPSPFSLLPTELIRNVIESAVPHLFDFRRYHDRQWTLRSFCVVSKLFHQIAKPLPCAVVYLSCQASLDAWRSRGGGGETEYAREIAILIPRSNTGQSEHVPRDVGLITPLCRNLTTFVLNGHRNGALDISQLSLATRKPPSFSSAK